MDIPESTYYKNITAPLRVPELARNMRWSSSGFSYTSNNLAFVMTRVSKNSYTVQAIYSARFEELIFGGSKEAVNFAIKLVALDLSGLLN